MGKIVEYGVPEDHPEINLQILASTNDPIKARQITKFPRNVNGKRHPRSRLKKAGVNGLLYSMQVG